MKHRLIPDNYRNGFALAATLAVVLILAGVAAGLTSSAAQNGRAVSLQLLMMKSKLAAEGAVETAVARAKARPDEQSFKVDLNLLEQEGEKLTASYELTRRKVSDFGKTLKTLNPEAEVWLVKTNAKSVRGTASGDSDITAILQPLPKRVRVLVWSLK